MSEVAIPLTLLILGIALMLWEMVQADRRRARGPSQGDATHPEEDQEKHHATRAG